MLDSFQRRPVRSGSDDKEKLGGEGVSLLINLFKTVLDPSYSK